MTFLPEVGVGFPSASRELACKKMNFNDPNGYYSFLDLPPWATDRQIRERCRYLLAIYHPDGRVPDRALFERVSMIYKVLRDPVEKAIYEHIPEGKVYADDEVVQAANEGKVNLVPDPPKVEGSPSWSYFTDNPEPADEGLASHWYDLLLEAAWDIGWTGRIHLYMTTKRVNGVVGEEVYVWKYNPTPGRAEAIMKSYTSVGGFG